MPTIHRRRRLLVTAPKEQVLDRAVAYWDARGRPRSGKFGLIGQYSSGPLLDLSQNGHTAQLGSSQEAVIDYDYDGARCLKLPGASGNYASALDSAALSVTGDIDIRWYGSLDDWTPASEATLVAKWDFATNNRSYILGVDTSGKLKLYLSDDGAATLSAVSSAATGITDGSTQWTRATWRNSDDRVQFFLGGSGAEPSWSQLGTDQSIVQAGTFDGDADVTVGMQDNGTTNPLAGKTYRAQVYNGIAGTLVFDANFAAELPGTTSFAESANGATVTVNQSGSDTNDPLFLPWTGDNYLYLPGTASNNASTQDAAVLRITGDLDIRVCATLSDWTPGTLYGFLARWTATLSYRFFINASGTLGLSLSDGSTTTVSSSAVNTITDGTKAWVRVTWRQSDGRVQFFTSTDGTTWSQLGTDQTISIAAITAGTDALEVGSRNGGTIDPLIGNIYRAQVYNGIDGTLVFDFDPQKSFTLDQANSAVITINRSATGAKSVEVTRPGFLLHTDDYFEIADHADLDFGATDSFTLVAVVRVHGTGTQQIFISKQISPSLAPNVGYTLYRFTNDFVYMPISDGAAGSQPASPSAMAAGTLYSAVGRRSVPNDNQAVFFNGSRGALVTDLTTGTLANALAVRIGADGSGAKFLEGEFYAAAIFREALSDADIVRLQSEFGV